MLVTHSCYYTYLHLTIITSLVATKCKQQMLLRTKGFSMLSKVITTKKKKRKKKRNEKQKNKLKHANENITKIENN